MIVTINTDASFHPTHKIAAYAFWIVCNDGKIMHSGELKGNINSSTEAEVRCIGNSLHTLLKSDFSKISKVIINTDCLHFEKFVLNRKKEAFIKTIERLKTALVSKYSLKKGWLEIRHVKAHSGTEEARKWVNNWCDKKAKEHLKEMITKKAL